MVEAEFIVMLSKYRGQNNLPGKMHKIGCDFDPYTFDYDEALIKYNVDERTLDIILLEILDDDDVKILGDKLPQNIRKGV